LNYSAPTERIKSLRTCNAGGLFKGRFKGALKGHSPLGPGVIRTRADWPFLVIASISCPLSEQALLGQFLNLFETNTISLTAVVHSSLAPTRPPRSQRRCRIAGAFSQPFAPRRDTFLHLRWKLKT
jgi:hypothetical protein